MKPARHPMFTSSAVGRSSSAKLIAAIVFVVVMLGTIAVVYLNGKSTQGTYTRRKTPAEIAEAADAAAQEQRARQLAQRQVLLKEAKRLLNALDTADERIEGAKKVFSRFTQDEFRRGNQVESPPQSDNEDLGGAPQRGSANFPISHYEQLRSEHRHLGQYHGNTRQATPSSKNVDPTIFVGLASHRQPLCAAAVSNLFHHANNARRIYVGLVEVHGPKDPPCLPEELTSGCQLGHFCITDHIRVRDLEPAESKGLAHGRYLAGLLYRGQDYVMFAAVPTFFAPHWDTELVAAHLSATRQAQQRIQMDSGHAHAQVVLSTAPESVDPTQTYHVLPLDAPLPTPPAATLWEKSTTSVLCRAEYDPQSSGVGDAGASQELSHLSGVAPRGIPRFTSVIQPERKESIHQPWVSMKFLFANATILQEVPLDPYLPFIERESEEDALYSARLWASGWDAYSPRRSVVFQWKNGDGVAGTMANDVPGAQYIGGKRATIMRIQYLLHALHPKSREPLVPDDVVLHEVIVEASAYGVRWGSGANLLGASKEREAKRDAAAVEGRWIDPADRNLERWYRYAGLNPSSYLAHKQWCREAERP